MWSVIEDGLHVSRKTIGTQDVPKEKSEWDANDLKLILLNKKAMQKLCFALVNCTSATDELSKVLDFESATEIWDRLEEIYEGTNQVKQSKISMLEDAYERFRKKPEESISEMFGRFMVRLYTTNVDKVWKILWSLPKNWEHKVTAIREAKDLTKLSLDELLDSLMAYEIRMKGYEEEDNKQKKLAPKSSHHESNDDIEDDESEEDEEIALIIEEFKRFLEEERLAGRNIFKRDVPRGESSKKETRTSS